MYKTGDMQDMAKQMTQLLVSKRAMLYEYFSLQVNECGELLALPLLLGKTYSALLFNYKNFHKISSI